MADNLVKRLQDNVADIIDWNGKVMTAWDTVRAMIANGNKGSLPRDIMESYLFGYAEDMAEAADRIEKLEAALQRANANVEEYERKFYLGTDRIEKLEAALREAVEDIEFWGAYANEYFQDKHDLKSSIQNARKALEEKDD